MKRNILNLYIGLIFASFLPPIKASPDDALVDKYILAFESDGTGMIRGTSMFRKEVPISKQIQILSEILDRALAENPPNYLAVKRVLLFLKTLDSEATWSAHLEKVVYAQIKSSDGGVRGCVATLLAEKQKDKAKDIILSFQDEKGDRHN